MGKTYRNAGHWWENRFKYGDPMYPSSDYEDGRFQAQVRNRTRSYYHEKLDPRSMKTIHWAEMGKSYKNYAKRVARHAAKIMVLQETWAWIQEEIILEKELLEELNAWHDDFGLDFSVDEYWDDSLKEEQENFDDYEEEYYFPYDPYGIDYSTEYDSFYR